MVFSMAPKRPTVSTRPITGFFRPAKKQKSSQSRYNYNVLNCSKGSCSIVSSTADLAPSTSSIAAESTVDVAPASFSSEEDCNASAASLTETEDCIETDSIDHSSTSSAEITETRTSALPILSVDLTDLSTCPPPSSLSDDQK